MEEGGLRETCLPIHRRFIASKRPSDARLRFFATTWHCTFHHIAFIPSFRNSSLLYTLQPCSSKRQSARARQLFCSALERECKRKRHWQIDVPDIRAICISTFIHIYIGYLYREWKSNLFLYRSNISRPFIFYVRITFRSKLRSSSVSFARINK